VVVTGGGFVRLGRRWRITKAAEAQAESAGIGAFRADAQVLASALIGSGGLMKPSSTIARAGARQATPRAAWAKSSDQARRPDQQWADGRVSAPCGSVGAGGGTVARSVSLRRQVVEADPKDVMARERLAYGLNALGQVRGQLGLTAEARLLLHEAIAVQEGVVNVTGDTPARVQLADFWFEVGVLEERALEQPAACVAYGRAQRMFAAARSALSDSYKTRLGLVEKVRLRQG
jgi:hypothetical protein